MTIASNETSNFLKTNTTEIVGGAGVLAMLVLIVTIIVLVKRQRRKAEREKARSNKDESPPSPNIDAENPLYGTYSRGWDGEGDYGDGDRVEITDNNPYYGT
jgi:hypothetical protein